MASGLAGSLSSGNLVVTSWSLSSSSRDRVGFWSDWESSTTSGGSAGGGLTAGEDPASAAAFGEDGRAGDGVQVGSAVAAVVEGEVDGGAGEDEEC